MPAGIMVCTLILCYGLRDVWHVRHIHSGALDMRTRIRPADWCARGSDIAGGWDLCGRLESESSRTVS